MKTIVPFILFWFCIQLDIDAQKTVPSKSILVLHSVNFDESWTKQTFLEIKDVFEKKDFSVKGISLQIPGIITPEDFKDKRQHILEEMPAPPALVVCIGDPAWLICRPLFDNEWKDVPSIPR